MQVPQPTPAEQPATTQTHRADESAFAFTATACNGAVRLRASGRRTLAAGLHEHQLFIHLVLHDNGSRVLRVNKSSSAAEFLAMGRARRARAVACLVARARFPTECCEVLERVCALAAARGRERTCDDVTVAVVWRPRAGEEAVAARPGHDASASADRPYTVLLSWLSMSASSFLSWLLGWGDES